MTRRREFTGLVCTALVLAVCLAGRGTSGSVSTTVLGAATITTTTPMSTTTTTVPPNFLLPNKGTFSLELFIFLLILLFMALFVLPPIRKAMADRQARIATMLGEAEKARECARQYGVERFQILTQAREEARRIFEYSNLEAERVISDYRTRGEQERARLVATGREEVRAERDAALDDLASSVDSLSLLAAERILGLSLSHGDDDSAEGTTPP